MIRLLILLLCLFIGPHALAQPSGCTTTTCTGSALPSGYLTVSGNQFQSNTTNVRLACAEFYGQPNDGSMVALRAAGFNCIRLGWRDATLFIESNPGTTVTTVGPSIVASQTPGSAGSGNVITITSGAKLSVNGVTISATAGVVEIYYNADTAYQKNNANNWFGPIIFGNGGSAVADPTSAPLSGHVAGASTGCNSITDMQTCVANAAAAGLAVIFDHRGNESVAVSSPCWLTQSNGLWYDSGGIASGGDGCGNSGTITSAGFQSNWVTLASAFNANPTVIGAELHQNPLVFGAAGTRTTTAASGSGFTVNSSGQIIDPNGVSWVARGYSVTIGDANAGTTGPVRVSELQRLFPRTNYIRIWGDYTQWTPSALNAWFTSLTNLGIAVQVEDYTGNGACRTGGDLAAANAWYQTAAAFYKANKFVVFESQNECFNTPGSDSLNQIVTNYNAVRAGGYTGIFFIGSAGGAPDPANGEWYFSNSAFAPMTNIAFDIHPYPGAYSGVAANQSAYNAQLQSWIASYSQWHTNTEPKIPVIAGEIGNCGNTQQCNSNNTPEANWQLAVHAVAQVSTTAGVSSGSQGVGYWEWGCGGCDGSNIDTLQIGAVITNPYGVQVQGDIAGMPGSGPTPASGGTGGPATVTWGAGGSNDSDILQMCSSVGTAINAANSGVVIFCPGPINGPAGTKLLNGVTKPTDCTNISDLSNAGANAMTGFPVNKMAYSAHFYPQSINGTGCVDSGGTLTADLNTYFGYLEVTGRAPVDVLEMGCSCDGIVGNATDENAWGSAFTQYLNGMATGGPQFTGSNQPMSTNWWVWSNPQSLTAGLNPDGIRNPNNTTLNVGQQTWWNTLLYQVRNVTVTTTWNPSDEVAIVLTNNNQTATTSTTIPNGVRSTTSKGSGLYCWAVTASTIHANLVTGVANSSWTFVGGTANSIDYVPATGQDVFTNNVFLTGGSSNSVSGEELDMCANFNTKLFYVSSPTMVSASGAGSWNNSNTCTPTVSACGLSFSGMTGPYYLMFYDPNGEANAVGVLNTTGPFINSVLSSLPSGYSTWDQATTAGTGRPIINILGANDNFMRRVAYSVR